jgi:hypothetical protein
MCQVQVKSLLDGVRMSGGRAPCISIVRTGWRRMGTLTPQPLPLLLPSPPYALNWSGWAAELIWTLDKSRFLAPAGIGVPILRSPSPDLLVTVYQTTRRHVPVPFAVTVLTELPRVLLQVQHLMLSHCGGVGSSRAARCFPGSECCESVGHSCECGS